MRIANIHLLNACCSITYSALNHNDSFSRLQRFQHVYKPCIILRHHNTESDKFAVKTLEGGAVANHESLADAGLKNIIGGQAFFSDPEKDEVGISRIDFVSWNFF